LNRHSSTAFGLSVVQSAAAGDIVITRIAEGGVTDIKNQRASQVWGLRSTLQPGDYIRRINNYESNILFQMADLGHTPLSPW